MILLKTLILELGRLSVAEELKMGKDMKVKLIALGCFSIESGSGEAMPVHLYSLLVYKGGEWVS